MAVIASLIVLFLGIQCSVEEIDTGCLRWTQKGDDVCCDICYPGNRLVRECGRNPKELCKPCENRTYTVNPKKYYCDPCTQCVGAQVHLKDCTATTDTKCGCREGLACGDKSCSFCVQKCEKGFEPTENRSCRKCPNGTFNDKVHHKCKPWSTKCSNPNEQIVFKGDASNDIKCVPVLPETIKPEIRPEQKVEPSDAQDPTWPLFVIVGILVMFPITIIIIMIVTVKNLQKRKKTKKRIHEKIIVNPTDDPRTLIAIECSFHEAQQEEGSTCSSESLDSKDSSEQLIA